MATLAGKSLPPAGRCMACMLHGRVGAESALGHLEFIVRKQAGKIAAIGAGLAACSLALSPALSAVRSLGPDIALSTAKVSLKMLGSIGSFTPVTRDERLAKAYASTARLSEESRGFRFTPTAGSTSGERSLTVLVRAPFDMDNAGRRGLSGLGIAPMAYNLGRTKGLEHFASEASLSMKELPIIEQPIEMPTANFALPAKPKRFSTNLQVEARQQLAGEAATAAPQTLGSEKSYAVDLSSSYKLTRNLNVQAGLRYRGPDNRFVPLTDQAQDSQAVYVGTTFKF